MFSEKFFEVDKYNLNTLDKISTIEKMPRRFTSLNDPMYLPVLDQDVADKLNLFFDYRHLDADEILHEKNKYLQIEYNQDEIISFFLINNMKYSVISRSLLVWNNFAKTINCEEACHCKEKIDKMTDETDILETVITGILYDSNANYAGIRVFDPTYNLSEYENNYQLNKLNKLAKSTDLVNGVITIFHDSNLIGYKVSFDIPNETAVGDGENKRFKVVDRSQQHKQFILNQLILQEIITEEQRQTIENICVNNSKFSLEYLVNENGAIEETFLYHIKVLDFRDLTTS